MAIILSLWKHHVNNNLLCLADKGASPFCAKISSRQGARASLRKAAKMEKVANALGVARRADVSSVMLRESREKEVVVLRTSSVGRRDVSPTAGIDRFSDVRGISHFPHANNCCPKR